MLFTTATALSALSALAIAAPTPVRHQNVQRSTNNGTFFLYSSTGGAAGAPAALDGAIISANNYGFYIDGPPTASFCPDTVSDCPPGNTTVLGTSGTGTVYMNTEVPGGQFVYISPDGSLNYTIAHSGFMPTGSLTKGFKYVSDYGENTFGSLDFNPNGTATTVFDFLACPATAPHGSSDGYAVKYAFKDVEYSEDCVKIGLITYVKNGSEPAAWQYS